MLSLSRLLLAVTLSFGLQSAAAENAKPPAAETQPKQGQMTIDGATLAILIKATVLALHQANVTGNYSVLRDLGTPIFRERFDQAALTNAFSNLRARRVDLSPSSEVWTIIYLVFLRLTFLNLGLTCERSSTMDR